MGFFYFDESIQEKAGFIVGAFVYSKYDITPVVFDALAEAGLVPTVDEFKSGARMAANPEQAKARAFLRGLLMEVKTGIVVIPAADRPRLGNEALAGLAKILSAHTLANEPHHVFVDESIAVDISSMQAFRSGIGSVCEVHLDQDSRTIGGIQLADLAAHSMGVMLLEQQGLLRKMVKAGENSGYDPDLDIELGFELWASLRYSFFKAPQPKPGSVPDDPVGTLVFDVENFGLYVAQSCDEALRRSAIERFGECYLGCIH
ncbi:MAG: hypothetical protein HY356_03290 [Gammaproteobacteria bacterium]|nr:hypothetical protein [Gammaproteobacteria bacterium]